MNEKEFMTSQGKKLRLKIFHWQGAGNGRAEAEGLKIDSFV